MKTASLLLPLLTTFALAMPALAQDAPTAPGDSLPGGASSLEERHGDWTVSCAVINQGKQCAFSQVLGNADTGQRALSIELLATAADVVEGMLLVPFSLRFDAGVTLTIDEQPLVGPLPFLSCLPQGCLVPVAFTAEQTAKLKGGTALGFSAMPLNGNEPVVMTLSLAGFTAAAARTAELSN